MKTKVRTTKEWIELLEEWNDADTKLQDAITTRDRLFKKAKTWLCCHEEFGNHQSIPSMIEREIGKAVVKEHSE